MNMNNNLKYLFKTFFVYLVSAFKANNFNYNSRVSHAITTLFNIPEYCLKDIIVPAMIQNMNIMLLFIWSNQSSNVMGLIGEKFLKEEKISNTMVSG